MEVVYNKAGKSVVEVGLLQALGIEKSELERALFRLAYEAHERQGRSPMRGPGTAEIQESDLLNVFNPALGGDRKKFETAVRYIRDRAGLLLWRGEQTYSFPHRSFQEYLAASHLSNLPDPVQATQRTVCGDLEWWHEVYLLEVGRLREHLGLAVSLIDAICPENFDQRIKPADNHWRASALAGKALAELRLIKRIEEKRRYNEDTSYFDAKLNRVRGWLKALLETSALPVRERADAGNILACLEDPRPGVGIDSKTGLPDILWCEVPDGSFLMGSDKKNDREAFGNELPQIELKLPTFYISRYPVTNVQFGAFVQAGGYHERRCWTEQGWAWKEKDGRRGPIDIGAPFNLSNYPVVRVSWFEALAFCRWLNEKFQVAASEFRVWRDGKLEIASLKPEAWKIRVPKEEEWEKAARGTDGRIYPWGDEIDPDKANYDKTGIGATSAVGCFPLGQSPYGVLDMSGNVLEWCQTKWRGSYGKPADESLEGTDPRVVRGGSWIRNPWRVRCADRDRGDPGYRYDSLGFRLVVSPGSP